MYGRGKGTATSYSHDREREGKGRRGRRQMKWMDNIKHGKVEWSRLIGIPERKKVNGPLRARANFTFFT